MRSHEVASCDLEEVMEVRKSPRPCLGQHPLGVIVADGRNEAVGRFAADAIEQAEVADVTSGDGRCPKHAAHGGKEPGGGQRSAARFRGDPLHKVNCHRRGCYPVCRLGRIAESLSGEEHCVKVDETAAAARAEGARTTGEVRGGADRVPGIDQAVQVDARLIQGRDIVQGEARLLDKGVRGPCQGRERRRGEGEGGSGRQGTVLAPAAGWRAHNGSAGGRVVVPRPPIPRCGGGRDQGPGPIDIPTLPFHVECVKQIRSSSILSHHVLHSCSLHSCSSCPMEMSPAYQVPRQRVSEQLKDCI
ncbi:hypothetical protein DFJ74DRAFT_655564 [Hyaloraphidium curvatum]|nr:hypothetical protein DFJ74DRAFT_655564 [Hyaloraphidium curvatum]